MAITNEFDFLIQWHLTERCNLKCMHCYQTGSYAGELSLVEIRKGIDEITDTIAEWSYMYDIAFQPSLNVTGGEPFLFSHLFDILEYTVAEGFEVYILSNGILVTKEKASRLSDLGVRGVQVSMEGPEAIHESIRGRGSFASSIKGVNRLLDAGLEVTLNTTLSDINVDTFMEMKDLAISIGVHRLGFSRLVPSGKGTQMIENMLPIDHVKDLYAEIERIKSDSIEIVTGDPVATQMSSLRDEESEDAIPFGGCAAAVSGITVLPDGTIVPCRRLPVALGNIRTDSFRDIWASSPVLLKLRDKERYGGKCGRCRRWSSCRGCRAIAYACSQYYGAGDMMAEDPQCIIEV